MTGIWRSVRGAAFAALWSRGSMRRTGAGLVGIVLLLGVVGGGSLFAISGARRTQSAYERFLRTTVPSTMVVNVGGIDAGGREALDLLADLPQVTQARANVAFYVAHWLDGQPVLSEEFEALGSLDGRYFDQDRFTPLEGRVPDPDRADEVAVNEETARRYGYHVGQHIDFATVSRADVEAPGSATAAIEPRLLTHATIVGVGVFIEEVLQDDTDRSPLVLFTPAFVRQAEGLGLYAWQGLVLRDGDKDAAAVQQFIIDESGGGPQIFRSTSTDTFHAVQAVRPVSLALAAFGFIAGIACMVLVGQALLRLIRNERDQIFIARALGAGRGPLTAAVSLAPVGAIVIGAFLAAGLSFATSPVMPLGRVRRVEPQPGIDVDWTVIGFGGATLMVGLCAALVALAFWEAGRPSMPRSGVTSRSALERMVDGAGLPPVMTAGASFTLSTRDRSVIWSVVASATIAVGALVAAVTFGASLQYMTAHPYVFGWNWHVALVDGAGYGNTNPIETQRLLSADPDVDAWGGAFFGAEHINGLNVPLLGMDPLSAVTPPIRTGRLVQRRGEIVLGTATMEQLGVHIGDTVTASSGPLLVVGSATFPTIGIVHGDHTSLGVGGLVTVEDVPGYDRNVADLQDTTPGKTPVPGPEYGPNVVFVRFRSGADIAAVTERMTGMADQIGDYNGVQVVDVQRPAEIVNANAVSSASSWLAIAIATAAAASFALALTEIVRRRQRDLAILEALGFTRRQVSSSVAWHATFIAVIALAVGVPVGIVLGRATWTLFAHQLDVLAEPATPIVALLVMSIAVLVTANTFALLRIRLSRAAPGAVLRGD